MKKFLVVLLALCSLLTCVTSCDESTEALVNDAIANTQALDAYEAEVDISISMDVMGMKMDIPMTMLMKMTGVNTDSPISYCKITMAYDGETSTSETYMDKDWVYVASGNDKYKMSVADAEEETKEITGAVDNFMKDMPASVFEGTEVVKNSDGTKSVKLNISGDLFRELYSEIFDSMMGMMGSTSDGMSVEFSDIAVTVTVGEKYISVYDISLGMTLSMSGVTANANVKETLTFTKFGDDVVITPMTGYQSYPTR